MMAQNMDLTHKNNINSFVQDVEDYLNSKKIPYVISDSNGMFGRTTNIDKYRETDSTLGALQSVAAFGGLEIIDGLSTDNCMPIISHIGNNTYLTTMQFKDTNISYVTKIKLTKNDINSIDTIYKQTCDAIGTFLTNNLEDTKIELNYEILKLKDRNNIDAVLDNLESKDYTSVFLSNLATIHAARDEAITNSNISANMLPVLYIPYTIDDTHYLIVSEQKESDTQNTPYILENKILELKNSKIIDFWKQQEQYKTICDIAKEYGMIKNN